MIKKSISFLFVVLLLSACRKDEPITLFTDTLPDPEMIIRPPRPMVKTIISTDYQGNVRTEHYYYDTLWRLIENEHVNGATVYTDTFTYSPGYVIKNSYFLWRLSSNGLAYEDNNSSWYAQMHYTYSADSFMSSQYRMSGRSNYIYDSNHNLTETHTQTEANPPNYIYSDNYCYYNNHPNTIGNYNTGQYYFGKSSTNLSEREENSWNYNGNTPNTGFVLYNYTYNDSGWVSRKEHNAANIQPTQIDSVTVIYDTTYYHTQFDYTYY